MKTHTGGVCSIGVIFQHSRQAEVRHLTNQVAVDQYVAGSQVSVDVAQVRQVGHAGRNAAQQPHQLDDGKLPVVPLQEKTEIRKEDVGGGFLIADQKKNVMILQQKKIKRMIVEKISIKIENRVKIRE